MMGARVFLRHVRRNERGVALMEMALISPILLVALFNVVDVARYAVVATDVSAASQAAAHAVYTRCELEDIPVTSNCPRLDDYVTTAIRGTSLGERVTVQGALDEA